VQLLKNGQNTALWNYPSPIDGIVAPVFRISSCKRCKASYGSLICLLCLLRLYSWQSRYMYIVSQARLFFLRGGVATPQQEKESGLRESGLRDYIIQTFYPRTMYQ